MNPIIYLADDDEDDRLLIREALHRVVPGLTFVEAQDGAQLLNLLGTEQEPRPVSSLPHLILLDMNMPKLTGMEVLRKLRASPAFRHIPTVIISTSSHPDQVREAYQQGVNAYVIKPNRYAEYEQIAESIVVQFLSAVP